MYKAVEFMTSNPAAMVQQAGIVALRDGEPYIAELREHYAARRAIRCKARSRRDARRIAAGSARRLLRVFRNSTTAAIARHLRRELVRETGVALAPGAGFGRDGEGYIRVCFASTEATITDAMERLKKFVMSRRS